MDFGLGGGISKTKCTDIIAVFST